MLFDKIARATVEVPLLERIQRLAERQDDLTAKIADGGFTERVASKVKLRESLSEFESVRTDLLKLIRDHIGAMNDEQLGKLMEIYSGLIIRRKAVEHIVY